MIVSEAVRRARWVEAEVVHLKRMGLSFDAIAEQITRVGRGQTQPITPLPDGLSFPSDYQISRQACHKACRKAIAREPALEVEELRKIDHGRSEDMFMNLQPAIRKGSARARSRLASRSSITLPRSMATARRRSTNSRARTAKSWVDRMMCEYRSRLHVICSPILRIKS
jgi:hypothetical protein